MKIMVVDDEKTVQRLFEQRFRKERRNGMVEFQFAFSGEEALTYLENDGTANLTLILSDINMPGMNGLQLLQIIKKNYSDLRVLMITAYDDEKNRQQSKIFGAAEYLTKPLDFEKLKKIIMN